MTFIAARSKFSTTVGIQSRVFHFSYSAYVLVNLDLNHGRSIKKLQSLRF